MAAARSTPVSACRGSLQHSHTSSPGGVVVVSVSLSWNPSESGSLCPPNPALTA